MYRVFLNVFDNALKYSLDSTRVYVRLEEKNNEAVATIINTAGYEMDFTSEEILQRFSRGDKARSTEGNGLGLSIAESFTNVSGGDFKLYVDGDQFKTVIRFKIKDNKAF
jgi:signal transduction histidine kinase